MATKKPKSKSKPLPKLTPGQRIDAARSKLGLSTAALASKVKLSSSFLSLVISDKRALSPASILLVAETLKLKPSTLLSDDQRADLKALQACANG